MTARRHSGFGIRHLIADRARTGRPAFSLIELMIAIVILGLGMVMVASMFPVALGRARELSEQTRRESIAAAAEVTLEATGSVDSLTGTTVTFAGDMVYQEQVPPYVDDPIVSEHIAAYADDRVHLLNMENLTVSPRGYVPVRDTPWTDSRSPWRLERVPIWRAADPYDPNMANVCGGGAAPGYCTDSFLSPRVRFEARFHPPLPMRDLDTVAPDGTFQPNADDPHWDELLSSRRYAYTVFHRLVETIGPSVPDDPYAAATVAAAKAAANSIRRFELYYVTLRRPGSTLRYARQDPDSAPNPNVLSATPVAPVALPPEEDVVLPEPWRVQIRIPAMLNSATLGTTTGVPTEVEVPPNDLSVDTLQLVMLAQMFQRGTRLIDEINGEVYRVVKRRLDSTGEHAYLTLDREITVEDVDLPAFDPRCGGCNTVQDFIGANLTPAPDPVEQLRTVWVFPPPVLPERMDAANGVLPAFDGPQPVVGIDKNTVEFIPRP